MDRDAAEALKFEAEAALARAKADEVASSSEKSLAEARKANAEALVAELEADTAQIALDRERYKRDKELADDDFHRVYRFTEAVDAKTAKHCMAQLATWHRLDAPDGPQPVEIVFTSPGGSIIDGMALFDSIIAFRQQGHHVTTRALGMAASMAGILLQAGHRRIMTPESWLLIHEASFGAIGSYGEVEDRVKWIERIQERILRIFAERSSLTTTQIRRRWHRTDWWISSDEALKFGFIDAIEP